MLKGKEIIEKGEEKGYTTLSKRKLLEFLSNRDVEIEETFFQDEDSRETERKPRYRITLLNKANLTDIEFHVSAFFNLKPDMRVNEPVCNFISIEKYPDMDEVIYNIDCLRKKGVYVRFEITDWNEMSDEAWCYMFADLGDDPMDYQRKVDKILFDYHVIYIIESDKDKIKVITNKETIKQTLKLDDTKDISSFYKINFRMNDQSDLPAIVKDKIKNFKYLDFAKDFFTISLGEKNIEIKYDGLYIPFKLITDDYIEEASDHPYRTLDNEFDKIKNTEEFQKIYGYIKENMQVEVEYKNPLNYSEFPYDIEELRQWAALMLYLNGKLEMGV